MFVAKEIRSSEMSFTNFLGGKRGKTTEEVRIGDLRSLNEIISALREICKGHNKDRVVVFDEFELVEAPEDRRLFGDLIKQLSDQEIPVRAIFCGIGKSVTALLDDHPSAPRYLAAVELTRLSYDARFEIIKGAESALGVEVEHNTKYRIAMISDGFPHYIHLICEKLFWEMYDDDEIAKSSNIDHYKMAIQAAVEDAQPYLQGMYDKAVRKYLRDYEQVLWAAADHPNLDRRSIEIFQSYCSLMDALKNNEILTRDKFNQRLNALKTPSHGSVLVGNRQGWYRFKESMLRGYVRLRAEQQGVMLTADHPLAGRSR